MTEDEITLFLEESGFVMEKSLGFPFVKTVIQSGENILFTGKNVIWYFQNSVFNYMLGKKHILLFGIKR
jgi:hypothetical protein